VEWLPTLVALLIVVLFPLLDRGRAADLRDEPTETERLRIYRHSLLALWLAVAAALAVEKGRQPLQVFAGPWVDAHRGWFDAAIAIACFLLLLTLAQGAWHASSAARRKAIEPAFAKLAFLLPVSRRERRWWMLLSLSAGIGEELLHRGYLFHFIDGKLGTAPAWLLGALAFGLAHLYQGWRGVVVTTGMGLLFGLLAIGTGNLALPIVAHVLIDLQVLWMYRPAMGKRLPGTG
jgi:membrane protease YdiL (CAAX protease family)